MDSAINVLSEILNNNAYKNPSIIAVLIMSCCISVKKIFSNRKYPAYIIKATISISIGLIILDFNILIFKYILPYFLSSLLIFAPIVISLFKFFYIQWKLKRVKSLAEAKNIKYNIIRSWELLQSLSVKNMIPRQRKQYKRYRLFLLIKLGNIKAVDDIIEDFKEEKAYYYFMQYIKYYSMGRIAEASRKIKAAEEVCSADTDPLLYVQILTNRGVNHVCMMNYQPADDYFYKAAKYFKEYKLKDKELLGTIYHNYSFNKTFLRDNSWESILEEYKLLLNMKRLNDSVSYLNIKLELLRQTEAAKLVIEKTVEELFSSIMELKFDEENKFIFVSNMARIAWAARINPSKYLNELTENIEVLERLPMPSKYNSLKDIDLLFMDLHGEIVERHLELKKMAKYYMLNLAVDDLESYRKSLPEDAVLEKCFCYMEIAGIQKKFSSEYDLKKVLSNLNSAIALYHENSLLIDEQICRMAIMDELCSVENLNEDYKLIKSEEMKKQLNIIELFLPSLEEHNILAEFYLRLSFYCMHLSDYNRCVGYYNKFANTSISMDHFAPWLHQYYMITSFVVRVIYFVKAIKKIKGSRELLRYSPEIQEWFKTYPNHDGKIDSMLLGRFLGYTEKVPLKIKTWIDPDFNNGTIPRSYLWLWIDEISFNIDITYNQFVNEKYEKCIFYHGDRHPFESGESYKIIDSIIATGLNFYGTIIKLISEENLLPGERKMYNTLYAMITLNIDVKCPTLEKLTELYKDTMLPVTAEG